MFPGDCGYGYGCDYDCDCCRLRFHVRLGAKLAGDEGVRMGTGVEVIRTCAVTSRGRDQMMELGCLDQSEGTACGY